MISLHPHGGDTMAQPSTTYSIAIAQHQHQQHRQQQQRQQGHEADDPFRIPKFFIAGGLAGALSRTATAPVDRLKMLLQVQEGKMMSLREGMRVMAAEGSVRSFFRGNGTNVLKIAPETSIKLALNDHMRHSIQSDGAEITPWQRMVCGGVSGAVGQVRLLLWGCLLLQAAGSLLVVSSWPRVAGIDRGVWWCCCCRCCSTNSALLGSIQR
eukprot:GHRQ01032956.1.p1 GENE.GHRQ01032956.1~~GHRQ01032956.1.p1  ORF type:complete len:211 (+),score=51.66 GHRQ01032956.1:282-914(+)